MIDWSRYVTLKRMAELVDRPYKTLHAYVLAGTLPALKRNGTRWYVLRRIVKQFKDGGLDVSGAFRKRD
jgi:hypothetical protein